MQKYKDFYKKKLSIIEFDLEQSRNAECTFHPQCTEYNALPRSAVEFYEEQIRFLKNCENQKKHIANKLIENTLKEMKKIPTICEKSKQLAENGINRKKLNGSVHERLYFSAEKRKNTIYEQTPEKTVISKNSNETEIVKNLIEDAKNRENKRAKLEKEKLKSEPKPRFLNEKSETYLQENFIKNFENGCENIGNFTEYTEENLCIF